MTDQNTDSGLLCEVADLIGNDSQKARAVAAWLLRHANSLETGEPTPRRSMFTVSFEVVPGEGQAQAEAEAEMARIFREYLTLHDFPFLTDYAFHRRSDDGYCGPWVKSVRVRAQTNQPQTGA